MKFANATIKAIRNDIVKGTISVTFELTASDQTLKVAEQLSKYADKDAGHVAVEVTPAQLPLMD